MCDCNKKISIALEISENLPSSAAIDRWCGEPVKAAILSTSIFLTNKKGYPVLSRAHQLLLKRLFKVIVFIGSFAFFAFDRMLEIEVIFSGSIGAGSKTWTLF